MPVGETDDPLSRPRRGIAIEAAHLLRRAAHPHTIMMLVKQERPLHFFGLAGAGLLSPASASAAPVVLEFLRQRPGAAAAHGAAGDRTGPASSLSFVCGLVLEQVARGRQELKHLAYLSIPAIGSGPDDRAHVAGAAGPPDGDYDADVVILALDRAEETVAAIGSALAQTGVSRHVFIVDQGHGRRTWPAWRPRSPDGPDATLVALDRNHGVAGGRNRGSALGHGRVIFGLDNDAEFADATHARPRRRRTGRRPDARRHRLPHPAARTRRRTTCRPGVIRPACCPRAGRELRCRHLRRRRPRDPPRAAWDGYDEALFFCWEEFDFCLRAIERGWRIRYRGDIAVRHKVCPERRIAWSGTRWFHFVRNRLYIERKWGAGWLPLLPRFAFYLLKGAAQRPAVTDTAAPGSRGRHVIRYRLAQRPLAGGPRLSPAA